MNARKPKERLQPCLLDRLLDDSPALDAARARLLALETQARTADPPPSADLATRIALERSTVRELEERVSRLVVTEQQLRVSVMRDLGWLLGTPSLDTTESLDDYPDVQRSVLNYGMRAFAGANADQVPAARLEAIVREAIERFEPRILPRQLSVSVSTGTSDEEPNVLAIEIRGEMWAQPLPQALHVRSLVDLESGEVDVKPLAS